LNLKRIPNDYYLRMLGFSRAELEKGVVRWLEATPPEWLSVDEKAISELRKHGFCTPFEKEYIRRDGSSIPVLIAGTMFPGDRGEILAFVLDITERKRAEEALAESEHRFRLALRNAPVSVSAQDRDLRFTWAYNQRTARPEEILEKLDADIFVPEEAARLVVIKKRVLEENIEVHEKMWFDRPSGRMFLDVCFEPIRDEAGRAIGVGTATIDLTQMKIAEETLRESEEKYRHLIEHAPSAIYEIDFVRQRFISVNEGACKMLGYSEAELMAMSPMDILDGESRGIFLDRVRKAQAGELLADYIEYKAKRKDGSDIWGILHPRFRYSNGQIVGAFVIAHDITERKQEEHRIRRYNRILDGINRIFSIVVQEKTEEELGNECLSVALEVTGSQFGFVNLMKDDGLLHDIAISEV
jgi:PAS domain S-box-containing protein